MFACPEPSCYYRVSATDEEDARKSEANHGCPRPGDTKIGWAITMTLVGEVWSKLDQTMDNIMTGENVESEKIRARAFAEVLAIFMVPHFHDANEIAKEAAKRYKARKAGEDYETVGLATRRYEFPRDKKYTERATVKEVKHNLTERQIEEIKMAATMLPHEVIAKTYGVSVAIVTSVL